MNDPDFVSEERELTEVIQHMLREGGLDDCQFPKPFTLHRAKTHVRGYILTTNSAANTVLGNMPGFDGLRSYNGVWVLLRDDALRIIETRR